MGSDKTADRKTSKTKAVFIVSGVIVAVLLAGLATWFLSSPGQDLAERYNAIAKPHSQKVWERAQPTPGQQLTPGPTAQTYRQAIASCPEMPNQEWDRMTATMTLLATAQTSPKDADTTASPACQALGLAPDSPLGRHMGQGICAWIKQCHTSVELLVQGANQTPALGPDNIWDPDGLSQNTVGNLSQAINLNRAALLEAVIAGEGGKLDQQMLLHTSAIRMGLDTLKGTHLVGAMLGITMFEMHLSHLAAMAQHAPLSPQQWDALRSELAYMNSQTATSQEVFEGEYLTTFPMLFNGKGLQTPPGSKALLQRHQQQTSMLGRLWFGAAAADAQDMWDKTLALTQNEADLRVRLQQHDALNQQLSQSINPLTNLLAGMNYGVYDQRITAAQANVRLHTWAMAAVHHRAQTGQWPSNPQTLAQSWGQALPQDPLMRAPFEFKQEDDGRLTLTSAALQDPIYQQHNIKDLSTSLSITVRPAPANAPADPSPNP